MNRRRTSKGMEVIEEFDNMEGLEGSEQLMAREGFEETEGVDEM